jgi:hypothetical protein
VVFCLRVDALNGQMLVLDGGESLLGRQRDVAFEKKAGDGPFPRDPA